MNSAIPTTPFDPDRYIGTVTQITPDAIGANLPYAASGTEERTAIRGVVGDFVFVECEEFALFGRLVEVKVPDRDRLSIEPEYGKSVQVNPVGNIRLLASINLVSNKVSRGLVAHPRIGDRIFNASPELIALLSAEDADNQALLELGNLSSGGRGEAVRVAPEKLFGRHCGVLGTTGGGKSWTVATLFEGISELGGKAILFDATGEFAGSTAINMNTALGNNVRAEEHAVSFSYREMTEGDIFTLFNPSGGVQGPKLREAIKSLKLVESMGANIAPRVRVDNGVIVKSGQLKDAYYRALNQHRDNVNSAYCSFDITNLPRQIDNECVWATDRNNPAAWGGVLENERGYCATLVGRIEQIINSHELSCVFAPPQGGYGLAATITQFVENPDVRVMRVSMEHLSFQHNSRELIANAIGRFLLDKARGDIFQANPMVILLDEAHQFLDKSIGDEFSRQTLDAFGLIAKEGRKYGLTCVLSTQRPRDVPEDVLSQLGTLIVHRLINDGDRRVVERSCGELDRSATAFLPTLDQGEALLVGADFNVPIPLRVRAPTSRPNSTGPRYHEAWGN